MVAGNGVSGGPKSQTAILVGLIPLRTNITVLLPVGQQATCFTNSSERLLSLAEKLQLLRGPFPEDRADFVHQVPQAQCLGPTALLEAQKMLQCFNLF